MGTVYSATRVFDDKPVAVKVLRTEKRDSRISRRRFAREAQALAAIDNPHVARLIDYGELDDHALFIVLELMHGEPLSVRIKREAPMDVAVTANLIRQACEGLSAAHDRGIVHRDLKPGNLFCVSTAGGTQLKVFDFGVAKATVALTELDHETLTKSAAILGTPTYMSPEQLINARDVDHRADVWSLGVITHRMLTGRRPHESKSIAYLMAAILTQPAKKLRDHRPDLPAELEAVVLRCLDADPTKRHGSVYALSEALLPFCSA